MRLGGVTARAKALDECGAGERGTRGGGSGWFAVVGWQSRVASVPCASRDVGSFDFVRDEFDDATANRRSERLGEAWDSQGTE